MRTNPNRLVSSWKSPAGYGFIMLATMQVAYGFANSVNNNVITNFFADVLHFTGPQFGYMTAIREVGGLMLIALMAVLYRVSIPRLTATAMVLLAVGYALFGFATGFASIIPWILISSFGMHIVFQTQFSLGMSLTTQERSGHVLGRMGAYAQAGTFVALVLVFFIFRYALLSYRWTFIMCGVAAFAGAVAIFRFPDLHEGQLRKVAATPERIVWRRDYRWYYWLNVLDGIRQQIFFSFGLWVLVNRFEMQVEDISLLLMIVTVIGIFSSPYLGRLIDRLGERRMLQSINVGYVIALAGYALSNNVYLACFFYVVYSFIFPFSTIGASTYLRKIAVPEDIGPSLAMGVTLLHVTAVVVPVIAGFILNFVGYQVPFFIACGAAVVTVAVTHRLDPVGQRSAARVALDESLRASREASKKAADEEASS